MARPCRNRRIAHHEQELVFVCLPQQPSACSDLAAKLQLRLLAHSRMYWVSDTDDSEHKCICVPHISAINRSAHSIIRKESPSCSTPLGMSGIPAVHSS